MFKSTNSTIRGMLNKQKIKNSLRSLCFLAFQNDVKGKSKIAFTLAETLITLLVIGIIAALTIPSLIQSFQGRETVARLKKMYSVVNQAVRQYQAENECLDSFADCFEKEDTLTSNTFMKRFEQKFKFVNVVYTGEDEYDVEWIPKIAKHINGEDIETHTWMGVQRNGWTHDGAFYMLADGSVLSVMIPDDKKQSGLLFIDTNGVKGPNRIGKDQFPIGIGARNNPKYAGIVHPHFNEDDPTGGTNYGGLCNVTNNNECSADECTTEMCSPTAYVLKHNKLPNL
ncbi:MAG: type II secretion system GspH family protein [bacterium]|nr:type II secretion system GspH family protein [bacterium]